MQRKLFFLHVPKCGGTSLDSAISACYGSGPRDRAGRVHLDAVAARRAAGLASVREDGFSASLQLYFMAQRDVRYISGHFQYSATAHLAFGDEWEFITMLRDPVSRWLSHYFYNRYKADDHYKIVEDLPAFLSSPRALRLANAFILQLTEHDVEDVLAQPRDCATAAIDNLKKFALVGCLERLDSFVSRFEARYGVKLDVPRLQTNPAAPSQQAAQINDTLRERVAEMCRADMLVYRYALSCCTVVP